MRDIGRVGLWTGLVDTLPTSQVRDLVQEIEAAGWPTLWRPEASGRDAFVSAAHMLDATTTLVIATGIAQTYARHPHAARAGQLTLHEASGGRFLLGLGVSHSHYIAEIRKLDYSTPYSDMVAYLRQMAEGPFTAPSGEGAPKTVIAALGPKMLRLAAEAADGAHPYFANPEHTAQAREIMGPDALLAPEQMVVIDTDRSRAHATATRHMSRYLQLPNYTNNLRRLGFTDDDIAGPSPRLIDAVVACGDIDAAVARVAEQHAAGADHVCIQVLRPDNEIPRAEWAALADALL